MLFMPYQERDEALVISWLASEKQFYQWSSGVLGPYPLRAGRLNDFYREWKQNHKYMVFCGCDDEMNPVGQMILRYPDEDRRHIRFGFILIDPARRGRGLGRRMLELAIGYARDYLKAEDICLGVYINNPGAVALYEKLGFRATGEIEESEYMGETWHCQEMMLSL